MQWRITRYGLFIMLFSLLLDSCSNTKHLSEDQIFYTGKQVVVSPPNFKDRNASQIINSVTAYKPNNSIAGKRVLPPFGLWIHNYWNPKKNKKTPGWFYRTFSSEPVLVSKVNPGMRSQKLESELFSIGFFHANVRSVIDTSNRNPLKATITYFIEPGLPFRYHGISFSPPEDAVDSLINNFQTDLDIKPEDVFNLAAIKTQTRKITDRAQQEGYYFFNSDHINWTADTTRIPHQIDLRIGKSPDISYYASRKYTIDDITVRLTGQTDSFSIQQVPDTAQYDGITMISSGNYIQPQVIARAIYFRNNDLYSTSKHQQTMTHLNSYGVFRYVNMQFNPDQDSLVNQLDLVIELTTLKEISLDLEANVVTKSTGFSGPGFAATLSHGNLAGGANKLQLKLRGGFEWQWGKSSSSTLGTTSYNVGLSSSIIVPKILTPFNLFNTKSFRLPQTSMTLGFDFLNKIQYYRMSSTNLGYGYQWKKSSKITHVYYPLFFNSITLLETTPEFDSILNANPYIRKSFEEQFIAGMKYDFTFDKSAGNPPHGLFLQAGISTAGNAFDLFMRISNPEQDRPYQVAGNIYSQFMKFTTDIRYYRNIRDHSFAFRLYSGLGITYSNSVVMPYVEQFYSGGSNSIRAFIARSVGPGGLLPDENSEIIDQTGDIKLEGNLEYRFRMSKVLHGAFFLDAGNVWLLNPDETRPGAEFNFSTFASQLAVGTGIGFRFDFNFFILRLDFGFPLRYAYKQTEKSNWIGSSKAFFDGMVLNLAIGNPF